MSYTEIQKQLIRLETFERDRIDNYIHDKNSNLINMMKQLDELFTFNHDGPSNGHHDNKSVIEYFPNALLVEETTSPEAPVEKPTKEKKEKQPKKEDMWDFLNKITNDDNNGSDNDEATEESEANTVDDAKTTCISCGEFGSLIEDHRTSTLICTSCGAVNEELLDQGPEWRQYNNDDARGDGVNRCGCGTNPFFPKSSQGTFLVGKTNNRLKSKQRWGCVVYKEKSLNDVCEEIAQVCSKNGLTKIITDDAKILYKKFSDCKHQAGNSAGKQIIIRGVNRKSIIAGCVFKSCEKNKKPKSIKNIAKLFKLDEKKLTKGIKQLDNVLKRTDDKTNFYDQFQDNDIIVDLIYDRCPKINIHGDDIELAVRIAKNCCRMKLASDHNPESIAAGSVLLVVSYCELNVDKKTIAMTFETTDVTIGKIYSKISGFVDTLIDDDLTTHIIKKFKING